jgi:hypothetical protein
MGEGDFIILFRVGFYPTPPFPSLPFPPLTPSPFPFSPLNPFPRFNPFPRSSQKMNRACSWNIRGGSMFANAGIAFVVVPTPPTNWPNVGAGVASLP